MKKSRIDSDRRNISTCESAVNTKYTDVKICFVAAPILPPVTRVTRFRHTHHSSSPHDHALRLTNPKHTNAHLKKAQN